MWQLHHVGLDVKTKFRVVFEGAKGGSGPTGGLSLDDINISETACPEFIWRVKNFTQVMENTPNNQSIFSPPFKSKEGYSFQMQLYPNGTDVYPGQLAAFAHLVAREGDAGQEWPCPWKQMTMMLMDQHPHIQKRMSNQRSVTTDPNMTATGGTASPGQNEPLFLGRVSIFAPSSQIRTSFSGTILARLAWRLKTQMGPPISGGRVLALLRT